MAETITFEATPNRKGHSFKIYRVSDMMHSDIKNIAENLGISITDFLKVELLHIISKHPAEYRKPKPKY